MIILGDSQFLTSVSNAEAKNLWTKLLAMMEAKQQLMDYFPAFCARHKKLSQIKLPSEFSKFSRDGGCDLPCTEMLECGHQCPHSCHPDISAEAHKKVRCTKPAVWTCHVGHSNKYTCCDGKPTDCRQCRKIAAEKLRIELEYEAERNRRLASQQELDQQIAAAEQRLQEKKRQHADAVVQLEKEQRIRELQLRQEEQEQETRILHQLRADEQAKALEELRMRTAKASAEETGKVNDKMEQLKHEEAVIQADTQTVSSLVNLAAAADKRDLKEFNLVLSKIDRSIHLVIANKLALSVGGAAVDWFAADLSFNGIVESAPSQLSYPLSLIAKGEYFKAREAFKAKLRAEENLTIEEQIVSIGYSLCSVLISSVKQCQQFIDEMIRVSPRLTSEIAGTKQIEHAFKLFYLPRT
jgi:TolA-binding protein